MKSFKKPSNKQNITIMSLKKIMSGFIVPYFIMSTINLVAAPSGKIAGTVKDALTGENLLGANISLQGTSIGAATNMDGEYLISNIPEGSYTVKYSYLGYRDSLISIKIVGERTLKLDVQLNFDVIEGETVLVTAQLEGQLSAINKQLSSNTIKNVVSSEKIMEVPDANAAESIGRLPGVSIIRSGGEASKVVIRGISPAYNTITVAGEKIPSTSLNDRGVDLGMISPEVLAGIEVTKALTADMEADAIGGSVNLLLNDAPGGFNYNFRAMSGYNDIRNDFNQFNGFLSLSNRFADDKFGLMVSGNRTRVQRGSDSFSSSYEIVSSAREGEEYSVVDAASPRIQYTEDIRERSSFSVFMDYKLSNGVIKFNNFWSRLDRDQDIMTNTYVYGTGGDNSFRSSFRKRIIQTDVMTTQLSGLHQISFGDIDWRFARSSSVSRHIYDSDYIFRQEGGVESALLPLSNISARNIIDATEIALDEMGLFVGNFRQEESSERDLTSQLNMKIPYRFSNSLSGYLKFGGRYFNKRRIRDRSLLTPSVSEIISDDQIKTYHSKWGEPGFTFTETRDGSPSVLNYLDEDFTIDNFVNGEYEFHPILNREELTRLFDSYLQDNRYKVSVREDLEDYEVDEEVTSGYVMTEINIGSIFMLLPGIRYEYTKNNLTGRKGQAAGDPQDNITEINNRISDTTAVHDYGNWFPMIHLRIKPLDWFDVRLAYTETISRPRMSYMLPKRIVESYRTRLVLGKPDLKPQLSTNFDMFLSFYGNEIGLFTIGGFYKEINNLIFSRNENFIKDEEDAVKEEIPDNFIGYYLDRPENNKNVTTVKGFEIEWQTNLHWLPQPFNGIVLTLNYSRIWSETNYPRSFLQVENIPVFPFRLYNSVDTVRTGRMLNQPDAIANLSIGYDYDKFSGRISMLYQDATLSSIGATPELDGFTDELLRFDLSVKFRLTDYISLYFNANNITNRRDASFLFGRGNPLNYPRSVQYYGYSLDFGIGISN